MAREFPDSGTVQFLAPSADPREGKEGTVYGAGHITTYGAEDKEFIYGCYLDGKIALVDPVEPEVELATPQNYPPRKQK